MEDNWFDIDGIAVPLGVTYDSLQQSYNFALYSNHAAKVTLLLYGANQVQVPDRVIQLDPLRNKSQRVWHCRLLETDIPTIVYYAFQVEGALAANAADQDPYFHAFNPNKILLDPYAKGIYFPPTFSRQAALGKGSNAGQAALSCLRSVKEVAKPFDWQGDQPIRHTTDLIIYEMHVRGFTHRSNSAVSLSNRGTYTGIIDKIPYLVDLGITAVELMPVFQFEPSENSNANFWGYNPLGFFAPHQFYSVGLAPESSIMEFKTMVRELHKAGIEVILDVVFNHSAEGDIQGPTYHFKGIDNSTYYLLNTDPRTPANPYVNFTGVGNTLRTNHPATQRFIVDALRFWVKEMHVDGFRFDLAPIFARFDDNADHSAETPIFALFASDPVLANVRLIAEPWDATGKSAGYLLGKNYPGLSWRQWNDKFRNDIRRYIKSDAGLVGAAMLRLYGSNDVFPDDTYNAYHPYQSINHINCHDGFNLYDLVAYSDNNTSWNCGFEGDVNVPVEVMQLRERQAKNFFTLLMLANGTPMFVAGDEFLNTQGGNGNPYNQDNETTWLDWDRLTQFNGFHGFVKKAIKFRKEQTGLGRGRFWQDDVTWYGANQRNPDFGASARSFAYSLKLSPNRALYVMINAYWEAQQFSIQEAGPWSRIINTYLAAGDDFVDEGVDPVNATYLVGARSVIVCLKDIG
ncbi:glycogen-debranching protein [Spirosoma foliorum]|uniref:Glycogen-debranching protein n=2 Tax=Spirosoma foliorum TaxID=2710596 RepID=A0A7G5H7L5_9BACT|nr:glycogen-debranching protein [Spirosoma foliorum]